MAQEGTREQEEDRGYRDEARQGFDETCRKWKPTNKKAMMLRRLRAPNSLPYIMILTTGC